MPRLATQIILLLLLLASLAGGIVMLVRVVAGRGGRSVFVRFLLVELSLYVAAALTLLFASGLPRSVPGFLVASLFLALGLNIPAVIVAMIASWMLGRRGSSAPPPEIPKER